MFKKCIKLQRVLFVMYVMVFQGITFMYGASQRQQLTYCKRSSLNACCNSSKADCASSVADKHFSFILASTVSCLHKCHSYRESAIKSIHKHSGVSGYRLRLAAYQRVRLIESTLNQYCRERSVEDVHIVFSEKDIKNIKRVAQKCSCSRCSNIISYPGKE